LIGAFTCTGTVFIIFGRNRASTTDDGVIHAIYKRGLSAIDHTSLSGVVKKSYYVLAYMLKQCGMYSTQTTL